MGKIVAIHSFRGGTGKSNLSANLACTIAARGYRVGVIDTDIASPGVHVLFGVDEARLKYTLNDYLWGNCPIEDAAVDLSSTLAKFPAYEPGTGALFLVPASIDTGEIARILHDGYDVGLLNDGILNLIRHFSLDFVLVDTHPGVNEETLLSIAISDFTLLILRPDQQDFQGTAVTVELARQLDVKNMMLIVNKVHRLADQTALRRLVEEKLQTPVGEVILMSDDMVQFGSGGLYCIQYPDHAYSEAVRRISGLVTSTLSPFEGNADRTYV
ncbi:MAG: MinD/ParA family protein [Candidatus Hydrogenedentes bacterium]|nr:MinD/ParA family protein [Candidatus Hydrogenedentota bacterium]